MPSGSTILSVFRFFYTGNLIIDSLSDGNIDRQNSILVNGTTYNDIIYYSYKLGFEVSDYFSEVWYANKIGMVKMKRKDGSLWALVN